MAGPLFIVSAGAPGRYAYLEHVVAIEGRDVMTELRSSGWALVRR